MRTSKDSHSNADPPSFASRAIHAICRKGLLYWTVSAFAAFVLGPSIGHYLDEKGFLLELRYALNQFAVRSHRDAVVLHTVVIEIDDDAHWKDLEGRSPTPRKYLANLILALRAVGPAVIAIDLDMQTDRSASDGGTDDLLDAIRTVATDCIVVLPNAVWLDKHGYIDEPDLYDTAVLPLAGGLAKTGVRTGYIALPNDVRIAPLTIALASGDTMDSFSQAIARGFMPQLIKDYYDGGEAPVRFVTYLPRASFVPLTATKVLSKISEGTDRDFLDRLKREIVLIGGTWSEFGYKRGRSIDSHNSPAGSMPGVFVHANYVEALLDRRAPTHVAAYWARILEALIVSAAAVTMAMPFHAALRLIGLLALCAVLPAASYILSQNFGRFLDFVIPMIIVISHGAWDQIRHWRRDANYCHAHHAALTAIAARDGKRDL